MVVNGRMGNNFGMGCGSGGTAVNGMFSDWNGGEPNNCCGDINVTNGLPRNCHFGYRSMTGLARQR